LYQENKEEKKRGEKETKRKGKLHVNSVLTLHQLCINFVSLHQHFVSTLHQLCINFVSTSTLLFDPCPAFDRPRRLFSFVCEEGRHAEAQGIAKEKA
jgi:hypothetical protein